MSYYRKHRESLLERQKKLNAKRQKEIKAYLKSYYSKNKSKMKNRQKAYYTQNKDYYREYMKKYHKNANNLERRATFSSSTVSRKLEGWEAPPNLKLNRQACQP